MVNQRGRKGCDRKGRYKKGRLKGKTKDEWGKEEEKYGRFRKWLRRRDGGK